MGEFKVETIHSMDAKIIKRHKMTKKRAMEYVLFCNSHFTTQILALKNILNMPQENIWLFF